MDKKIIVGATEFVVLKGAHKDNKLPARIDTGATRSSIHAPLVKELNLGPMLRTKKVRNANGMTIRPIINVTFELKGKTIDAEFTVTDRSHMKYKLLIGRNALIKGFLVDPSIDVVKGVNE